MKDKFTIEDHPDWYYEPPNVEFLILGSFPPHKSRWSYPFYYPNKINYFWKILASLAGHHLSHFSGEQAVHERKALMEKLSTGIQNMGKRIARRGTSAKDTDIIILEYHSVLKIIKKHTELHTIILAGYSAPHSTYNSFLRYLRLNNIECDVPRKILAGNQFNLNLNGRIIRCVVTNSTSPASFLKLDFLVEQYRKIFLSV